MTSLLIYLKNHYPEINSNSTISEFCRTLEGYFYDLFTEHCEALQLTRPPYGFLVEDCFTPWGDEECLAIIEDSLNNIVSIGQKLQDKYPDVSKPNIEPFVDLAKTTHFLEQLFQHFFNQYRLNNPYSPNLSFYNELNKKFGRRQRRSVHSIENFYTGITNILYEFAHQFPQKRFEYFYGLGLLHQHLKNAGFIIHYAATSSKTPIEIAYRDEGNGKGPFYDHYSLQRATQYPTTISCPAKMTITALRSTVETDPFALPYGEDHFGKKIPPISWYHSDEKGLLVITGRARNTETDRPLVFADRKKHEEKLIGEALLTGRPILAICAGSWRLFETCGGQTEEVSGHNCRSGMPRIITNGTIGYNLQIHNINITKTSLLAEAMGSVRSQSIVADNPAFMLPQLSVNSVHWQAPSFAHLPAIFQIAATSIRDDSIAPALHKTGQKNEVQQDTVEAFESKFGAPIFGIQWHPEAFNRDALGIQHHSLLKYCAQAGDTYAAKQRMLSEFKQKSTEGVLLSHHGLLKTPNPIKPLLSHSCNQEDTGQEKFSKLKI